MSLGYRASASVGEPRNKQMSCQSVGKKTGEKGNPTTPLSKNKKNGKNHSRESRLQPFRAASKRKKKKKGKKSPSFAKINRTREATWGWGKVKHNKSLMKGMRKGETGAATINRERDRQGFEKNPTRRVPRSLKR